ncbi:hypothetical protein AB0M20_44765 [Actinoplanes sp. NPDC051633]|uniref:hypothetical protein n=1 Tax=Actinoplanes sp. NPDC051633 TaxID=3155670 RepID=UPI00341AA3DD
MDDMLRAAHWTAARSGIAGTLFDPRSARPRPAWELVEDLVAVVDGALRRHGDRDEVHAGLGRIRREGTGADRQRRAFRDAGLPGVLEHLADLTAGHHRRRNSHYTPADDDHRRSAGDRPG